MTRVGIFVLAATIAAPSAAMAQAPANPMQASLKAAFDGLKGNISKSAEKVGEDLYAFKPTPEVRSFGQLIGHIADAQFEDPRDRQTVAPELRPDETGFLARDGDDEVDRERRSHQCGQDACLEILLEPADIVAGRHEDLLVPRRLRRRMPSAIEATGRGCGRAGIER